MATPTTATQPTQRRGKKDNNETVQKKNFDEHVNLAEASVMNNKANCGVLHLQWRTHLNRLSYLLILITMHLSRGPAAACLQDAKAINALSSDSQDQISGFSAMLLVLTDSMVSILSLVMATSLAYFSSLNNPHGDFSSQSYVMAVACLPAILSLHFNRDLAAASCVNPALLERVAGGLEPVDKVYGFPVVVVFFGILTASYWFMDMQMKQHETSVLQVLKLRKELQEQQKGGGGKGGGATAGSKKKN